MFTRLEACRSRISASVRALAALFVSLYQFSVPGKTGSKALSYAAHSRQRGSGMYNGKEECMSISSWPKLRQNRSQMTREGGISPVYLACHLCLPLSVCLWCLESNPSISFLPSSSWLAHTASHCLQPAMSPNCPANSCHMPPHSASKDQGDAFIHPSKPLEIHPSAFHFAPQDENLDSS